MNLTVGGSATDATIDASNATDINSAYTIIGAATNNISLGGGNYQVAGGVKADTIRAGIGAATIEGNDGNNVITAIKAVSDATSYSITGGSDNDTITLGQGTFIIDSGSGADVITVGSRSTTGSRYDIKASGASSYIT